MIRIEEDWGGRWKAEADVRGFRSGRRGFGTYLGACWWARRQLRALNAALEEASWHGEY